MAQNGNTYEEQAKKYDEERKKTVKKQENETKENAKKFAEHKKALRRGQEAEQFFSNVDTSEPGFSSNDLIDSMARKNQVSLMGSVVHRNPEDLHSRIEDAKKRTEENKKKDQDTKKPEKQKQDDGPKLE